MFKACVNRFRQSFVEFPAAAASLTGTPTKAGLGTSGDLTH
jgi:hypothetical protein